MFFKHVEQPTAQVCCHYQGQAVSLQNSFNYYFPVFISNKVYSLMFDLVNTSVKEFKEHFRRG